MKPDSGLRTGETFGWESDPAFQLYQIIPSEEGAFPVIRAGRNFWRVAPTSTFGYPLRARPNGPHCGHGACPKSRKGFWCGTSLRT